MEAGLFQLAESGQRFPLIGRDPLQEADAAHSRIVPADVEMLGERAELFVGDEVVRSEDAAGGAKDVDVGIKAEGDRVARGL